MKKDLVIIGSYPKREEVSNILYESIMSLKEDFDICLCTHYPAKVEIQSLVKYYIYDHRNEMIKNESVYFWSDYPSFYFESYSHESTPRDYSFAIFRLIMNALNLLKNEYDSFYYIEGDGIFAKEDIRKIKDIKIDVTSKNKKAWFFKFDDFLSTLIFYSNIEFFIKNVTFSNSTNEYINNANKVDSYGILENYIYKNFEKNNVMNQILAETKIPIIDFFSNSKLSLNTFNNGNQIVTNHVIRVLKIQGEQNLAFVYVNENRELEGQKIYLDNEFLCNIPDGLAYFVHRIYPKDDEFTIRDNYNTYTYSKTDLLNSKSFIILKQPI